MVNFTNPTNLTSMTGMAQYLNTTTPQFPFWTVMLITFFLMLFLGFGAILPREDSLSGASFVCLMLALLMKGMNLLAGDMILALFSILLMVGLAMQWSSRG